MRKEAIYALRITHHESPMMINSFERAGLHSIALNKPAVRFFEGAVLGNGGETLAIKGS